MSSLLKLSYKNSGGLEVNLLGPIKKNPVREVLDRVFISSYFLVCFF